MPARHDAGTGPSANPSIPDLPAGKAPAGSLILPRERRLTSARYRRVFDGGHRIVGRFMVLWWLEGTGRFARIGVVASRRSFRRAVDRNRARRLLREAFRCSQNGFRGPLDFVLVARVALGGRPLAAVENEFRHLCRRAGLWKTEEC